MAKPVSGLGAAPVLFGTVCIAVVSTIIYVHHNQKSEKEVGRLRVWSVVCAEPGGVIVRPHHVIRQRHRK